nr:hypothetical protein [Tanacetum cinerariifolium]
EGIREVEFGLQPSEDENRCFLGYNWLLWLVTHTRGCCLDKRSRWRESGRSDLICNHLRAETGVTLVIIGCCGL